MKYFSEEFHSVPSIVLNTSIYWDRYVTFVSSVQISLQKSILFLIPIYFFDILFWILTGYLKISMLKMELLIFFQNSASSHFLTITQLLVQFKNLWIIPNTPFSLINHIQSTNTFNFQSILLPARHTSALVKDTIIFVLNYCSIIQQVSINSLTAASQISQQHKLDYINPSNKNIQWFLFHCFWNKF